MTANPSHLAQPSRPSVLDFSRDELRETFAEIGEPPYRAGQLLRWIYAKRATAWETMTDLPAAVRSGLAERFDLWLPEVLRVTGSRDTTQKFLFRLRQGDLVESVLIPASPALYGSGSDRRTICLSTQVGCAYGCRFCASGLDGWKRNLSPGEIVGQFLAVEAHAGEKIHNIVFMGMGEPLANYDALMRAIDILNAPWGVGLGARHITVSTSGLAPRIRELAGQPRQIRLAISLHGATDEVRQQIMPVNKKYPLAELLDACAFYTERKKQRLSFEYILIAGLNDQPAHARDLVRVARPLQAKINLIPYNRVEGLSWERPDETTQENFLSILHRAGLAATIRREKGHDISAACGQLRLQALRSE
jgi:23S rRNA (adenine2503-C2)-methyltransferase